MCERGCAVGYMTAYCNKSKYLDDIVTLYRNFTIFEISSALLVPIGYFNLVKINFEFLLQIFVSLHTILIISIEFFSTYHNLYQQYYENVFVKLLFCTQAHLYLQTDFCRVVCILILPIKMF